jgi:hypothetical protein
MELTKDSGDVVALAVQKLWAAGLVDPNEVLLRIDYRREARNAPFQFDMVNGRLHRNGCASIPVHCSDALYAVWDPGADLELVGCKECRPSAAEVQSMNQFDPLDIFYGLISIMDQFGAVLKDRGKEYRASTKGQKLAKDLDGMFSALDQTQRDALRVTLDSLDGLVKVMESAKQGSLPNGKSPSTASPHNGNGNHSAAAPRNGNHRKKKEG